MRWLAFFAPVALVACPACSSNESQPVTASDTGAAEVCAIYDAGPAMEVAPPPDTLGEDEDAEVMDTAPPEPVITRAEIDDIISTSCAFPSCHGRAPGSGKLHLPAPPENWVVELVDVPSTQHKTMKRVVPGDPQNSYLVHKLTGGICAMASDCVDNNCGTTMPENNPLLPQDEIDKIVEWIRQGATEK